MNNVFNRCHSLLIIPDISQWNVQSLNKGGGTPEIQVSSNEKSISLNNSE